MAEHHGVTLARLLEIGVLILEKEAPMVIRGVPQSSEEQKP